jgi:hypothetical protein
MRISYPRRYRLLTVLIVLLALLPLIRPPAARAEPPVTTLADAVEPALRRLEAGLVPNSVSSSAPDTQATGLSAMDRWIAGPATVSATYLSSQEPWGTDELEFSVNVPLQTPSQRARLDGLAQLDPALDETAAAYRRWQVSGRLRDLFARHRRLELQARLIAAEVDEVQRLQVRARAQFEAGNLDSFEIWQIEQSLRELSAELEKLEADRDAVGRSFEALTGMQALPAASSDDGPPPEQPRYEAHPYARLLAMQLERELVANRAGSPRVQPWNVALVSRELAIADQVEWQHGVALSVPFDIGGSSGPTVRSGERSLRRSFAVTRDSWLADLQERWQVLMAEREALLAQQRLLTAPQDLASLERSLDAMDAAGELPIEQRLQRRRRLLQSQARPQQIEAALAANTAQLRQTAGLALGQD